VLDGIRAAVHFEGAGLGADTPVGLWGYSGGGHASAFSAEQQPTYAPEINLVAVAAGGVPGDLSEMTSAIDGSLFSGLLLGCVIGISREYPEIGLEQLLNDAGHQAWADLAEATVEEICAYFPFRRLSELMDASSPFELPETQAVFKRDHLGQAFPAAATYIYHSVFDQLLPINGVDTLVAAYRQAGVDVRYRRSRLGEHVLCAATGVPGALRFLASKFSRAAATVPTTTRAGLEAAS
jgi:hypothetical protein